MTRKTKFEDAFWGQDFCSSAGFEALTKRMKDARHMCKDFEQFLKSRAKVEEDYSKALSKVARNAGGATEIGTIRSSWECLREQTEQVAAEHLDASRAITDAATRLSEFMEKQKTVRKQAEDPVSKAIQKKKELYRKTVDSKKMYDTKCRELEQSELQVMGAKQSGTSSYNSKEWEKIYSKHERAKQEQKRSDEMYKNNTVILEQARQHWEKEMTSACRIMEQLENDRIAYLRNEMWVQSNILSKTWVEDDKHCENVRLSLEKCDVDADIELFIKEKSTGYERPAAIPYQAWKQGPPSGSEAGYNPSYNPVPSPHLSQGERRMPTMGSRPPQPLPSLDLGAIRTFQRSPYSGQN